MRKKLSLVTVGLLAGVVMSVGAASPASAHSHSCTSTDPVLAYVCSLIPDVPDVQAWIDYYYYGEAGEAVKRAYCTLWPDDPDCW